MEAKEIDSVLRSGKYPDGMTHVMVYAPVKEGYGDGYKWTSGVPTGNTDEYDEHFEVVTDSPMIETQKEMYHKEDIKEVDPDKIAEI